jgi:hypothetical protein
VNWYDNRLLPLNGQFFLIPNKIRINEFMNNNNSNNNDIIINLIATIFSAYAESEVLTAVVKKITTFWNIVPCSPLKGN